MCILYHFIQFGHHTSQASSDCPRCHKCLVSHSPCLKALADAYATYGNSGSTLLLGRVVGCHHPFGRCPKPKFWTKRHMYSISCLIILNTIWCFLITIVILVQKNDQLPIWGIKYCEPVAFLDQKQCRLQSPGSPGSFCRHNTTGTIYHVQETTNATEINRMTMETMH